MALQPIPEGDEKDLPLPITEPEVPIEEADEDKDFEQDDDEFDDDDDEDDDLYIEESPDDIADPDDI